MRRATVTDCIPVQQASISIHALLAESDCPGTGKWLWPSRFLSTLSLRRATFHSKRYLARHWNFYPRSPCGERLYNLVAGCKAKRFLSTLSLRRATCKRRHCPQQRAISIHALLAESDIEIFPVAQLHDFGYFYPRSPCGERRQEFACIAWQFTISIHALLAESDVTRVASTPTTVISIHALLAESDSLLCYMIHLV